MPNTVTYHVYLTFHNGERDFIVAETQEQAIYHVWVCRAGLANYAVYVIVPARSMMDIPTFVDLTETVGQYIAEKEAAR